MIKNILTKLIQYLENLIKQLNKSGVNSELSIYIYRDFDKMYILNMDNIWDEKEFELTSNIEEAFNFDKIWYRKLYLYWLNLNIFDEEFKFKFRNVIKLSGGNFGPNNTNISVNGKKEISLSDIDNLTMDDMQFTLDKILISMVK